MSVPPSRRNGKGSFDALPDKRNLVLVSLLVAGVVGLFLGALLDTSDVVTGVLGGVLAIVLVPIGYLATEINAESGLNLGNPAFALGPS